MTPTRLVGLALAAGLALVTLPVLGIAALLVAVRLGRPVLFGQMRSGLGGHAFQMRKLRTMTNRRGTDGRLLPDGERLTSLGRFLRRSRIDELPGLWHVLAGDMALVGPRPLLPETVAAMGEDGRRRGSVRPGLTGWAQVNGNARLSDRDKLALDLWYVQHRSPWLDLSIVLRTAAVVLLGERINTAELGRADAGGRYRGG